MSNLEIVRQYALRTYLSCKDSFLNHRLDYYASGLNIPIRKVESRLFPGTALVSEDELRTREKAIETLRGSKAQVIIVTAAHQNRFGMLSRAYEILESQKGTASWLWLVVNNGDRNISECLDSFEDKRIVSVSFNGSKGYAAPVRNFGLYMIHGALYRQPDNQQQVMVLDSDDRLSDQYSLHELLKLSRYATTAYRRPALSHGFTLLETEEMNCKANLESHPHDTSSSFPRIDRLTDIYDKGQNILAGIFPVQLLEYLRYPNEFSFEDNAFNHKLLLTALKNEFVWLAEPYPAVIKLQHKNSMKALNNGHTEEAGSDLRRPNGVRKRIAEYLHYLNDYFTREAL